MLFLKTRLLVAVLLGFTSATANTLFAAEENSAAKAKKDADKTPANVSLADDPATAMKKFRVAPGLKVDLFAAEPLLQDVVSFSFDEKGRAYVVESGRRRTSVYDIRKHRDWTDSDFSFRTVEDRANFFRQVLTPDNPNLPAEIKDDLNGDGVFDWRDLEVESERIRLVWDANGDGVAGKSKVFADDFKTLVSGVAAGVLVRKGAVYFTCIPDVWLLQDTRGADEANIRVKLHGGFGVHIAYGGHDMHGLKFGPDGKLYWTIADRGTSTNHFSQLAKRFPGLTPELLADSGAVFRCNLDGSDFELVAIGLRNPQELAFDQFGNLFTGDNNADGGDKARWEHIVEGADYGWRYGWQHLPKLGAWNTEHLWELAPTNTAAYLLPPVGHIGHGPAGIAFYPGTGLPPQFHNHFFYADFPGGIRHFALKPRGASFTVDNPGEYLQNNRPDKLEGKLLWGLYPTDIEFAPGGGAYVLDWVYGWEKTGKGRIYRVHDTTVDESTIVQETKTLIGEGFSGRPLDELATLLGHRDQRVRTEAQFAIVEVSKRKVWKRGPLEIRLSRDEALHTLLRVARSGTNQLARLHAIWGIGQLAHQSPPSGLLDLHALLTDKDSEVRAQAAKVLGDERYFQANGSLVSLLKDSSPRVKFFAATALGKIGNKQSVAPILAMLRENGDADPYLRHAGVMALLGIGDVKAILAAAKDESLALRMASLLAQRRLGRPEIAGFLLDPDAAITLEAARAIHDVPIQPAMSKLAALLPAIAHETSPPFAFTARRAINANLRLGDSEGAGTLAQFAASAAPDALRVEALEALGDWLKPPLRDHVLGLWRPLPPGNVAEAGAALQPVLEKLLRQSPPTVRAAAATTAGKLGLAAAAPWLAGLVGDTAATVEARIAALDALAVMKDARLNDAVKLAQADKAEALRRAASKLLGTSGGDSAVASLAETLAGGSVGERQSALEALGRIKGKEADKVISKTMDQLLGGKLAKELQLDALDAAAKRTSPSIKEKLKKFEDAFDKTDPLARYRVALHGGDAADGRKIFFERAEAGCFRCHKLNGEGGDVGPDLTGLAAKQGRGYLLEAVLQPNKVIAHGYDSVLVTTTGGGNFAGILKSEADDALVINSPEDGLVKVKKSEIKTRSKGLSPMPEGLGEILTRAELRDLIEFLAQAK
ncbi:MAG: HEAT repeat domain-containing protein [Verrucomicrobia bacterium]|nr:HEAT repeat domain-containing protein [Verrucomicrobiota bacterium]